MVTMKSNPMNNIDILLDGDILVYKVASAVEEPIHWGNDWWSVYGDAREGRQRIDFEIKMLFKLLTSECKFIPPFKVNLTIALSSPTNWRRNVLPTYKSNRSKRQKPLLWNPLRDYLIATKGAVVWDHLEADDVIGILAKRNSIVVSED